MKIKTVEMVRSIRDANYDTLKTKPVDEQLRYYHEHSASFQQEMKLLVQEEQEKYGSDSKS